MGAEADSTKKQGNEANYYIAKKDYKNTKEIIDSLINCIYQNQTINNIVIDKDTYIISFSTTDKKLKINLQQLRELSNRVYS